MLCGFIVQAGVYKNAKGEVRFRGTRDLKSSQLLGSKRFDSLKFCRAYPSGFGQNLREAFERHIGLGETRRDLRFKLTQPQQFERLALGDLWEDANLLEPMVYCLSCKHLRLVGFLARCFCRGSPQSGKAPWRGLSASTRMQF